MTLTYEMLLQHGFDPTRAQRALTYSNLFAGDWPDFIRQVSDILNREDAAAPDVLIPHAGKDRPPIVANHTGYGYKGSENFEHDDTGSIMNYSGVEDEMNNAKAEHEGWEPGYDYD